MVSAGGTDANPWDLKSRACRSSWGLVLSGLTMQNEQNEVKQHPSGVAQSTERCLLFLSLPWPLLRLQKYSHPVQRQRESFRGCHNTQESPVSWYHCIEYWERALSGEDKCIELTQDEQGLDLPLSSSLVNTVAECSQVGSISCPVDSVKTCQRKLIRIATSYEDLGVLVVAVVVSVSLEGKRCTENLVTWPSRTFAIVSMECHAPLSDPGR